ncbi:MAG: PQQ-binding-like beta-propeller repeat protein [Solirubrobacteraceae bacterium]
MKRPAVVGSMAVVAAVLVVAAGYGAYKLHLFNRSSTQRGEVASTNEAEPGGSQRRHGPPAWPIFRFDERRTGNNPAANLRPPLRIRWLRDAPNHSYLEAPPVVARGVLVAVSYTRYRGSDIVAVNAQTGRTLWHRHYRQGEIFASTPAIAGAEVYVTSKDGHLRVFDLRSGRLRWQKVLRGDATESTPIVSRGLVYFGRANGYMYAFDVRRRRLIWRFGPTGGNVASGVALTATTAYFASYGGGVYGLNRFTGRLRWKTVVRGARDNLVPFYSTPALARGRVLLGGNDGSVYALDARTGAQKWRFDAEGYVYASAAIRGGRLYIGDFGGGFHALSIKTGREIWRHQMGPILGSATVIRNVVYVSSLRPSRTVGLDPDTGRVVWRFRDGQFSPVIADDDEAWLGGRTRFYALRAAPRPARRAGRGRAHRRPSHRRGPWSAGWP